MKDVDETTTPIDAGIKVFVSLPASFPSRWMGMIYGRLIDLELVPYVYYCIPQSPSQHISNIEYEARTDMYSACLVFSVFSLEGATETRGTWILKYLPKLRSNGIKVYLALVSGNPTEIAIDRNTAHAWLNQDILRFSTADEWLVFLVAELRKAKALLSRKRE